MTEPRPTFNARKKNAARYRMDCRSDVAQRQVYKIEGFSSEANALKWIAERSETWLGNNAAS